ncbi:hypothetical protein [Floridanema aerugineum]|uniref:Uncharacterized protein n=1 Tax=Floridaenema aerugineum BLCC-F46 TaxID=3153654 RepID=A0ABV4X2G9_9CYAN
MSITSIDRTTRRSYFGMTRSLIRKNKLRSIFFLVMRSRGVP